MAHVPYASVVGSLMYVVVCTRPDISQAVSMVSRYMHNPAKNHWLAVKWILRYLYGTIDVGLLFKKDCGQQCVGYCDSDFAGDLDKRRSTTKYVLTLGGGPVSWRSMLQSTIALSTTEAEYTAATEDVKAAICLKGLLGDSGVIQENIAVFYDNQMGYTDSDFKSDRDSRKSTSGYVFALGSGAISWMSVKQSCITDSITKAEYVATSEAAKEAIWLCKFLRNLEVVPVIEEDLDAFVVSVQKRPAVMNDNLMKETTRNCI
ncbi:secreted RxLR effector protein 161-like [Citrus sinensis]|uniref:secreted RxLR effector protein 161-like n=1 Tax=Citrus sinensis TaxID=2711 RepID=UPI0022783323|nr:secreted RxLR effector protein 161-like [Citrus sinensis]